MITKEVQKVIDFIKSDPKKRSTMNNSLISRELSVSQEDVLTARVHIKIDKNKSVTNNIGLPGLSLKEAWIKEDGNSMHYYISNTNEVKSATDAFSDFVSSYPLRLKKIERQESRKKLNNNHIAIINLSDAHLGKNPKSEFTNEDYNLDDQIETFKEMFRSLFIRSTTSFAVERIVFPIGNDFVDFDTYFGTTTGGTVLDNSGNYHSIITAALTVITDCINMVVRCGIPIDVLFIEGNHSRLTDCFISIAINKLYENNELVTVNDKPIRRKYYDYGTNLLMFDHGELKDPKMYPQIMSVEAQSIWENKTTREVLLGHRHHKKTYNLELDEVNGITIRFLNSVTGIDRYHYGLGYINSLRRGSALVYNREEGFVAEFIKTCNKNYKLENNNFIMKADKFNNISLL